MSANTTYRNIEQIPLQHSESRSQFSIRYAPRNDQGSRNTEQAANDRAK
jgi:hypothetical protein